VNPAIKPFNLKFGKVDRVVIGGPYREKFTDHFGVKMAEEIKSPCDVDIPTRDFDVPDPKTLDKGVRDSLFVIARNKPVYVGCAGGIGRTGLYMAALAKVLGIPEPVKYVRANFKGHAVETKQQMAYVEAYTPSLQTKLMANVAKILAIMY
jgi:protein-tyrosine phosphatase